MNELALSVKMVLDAKRDIINQNKRLVSEGIYNIGKELVDIHDNVLKVKHGGKKHWQDFLASVSIPRTTAHEFMVVYKALTDIKTVSTEDYNKLIENTTPNSLYQLVVMYNKHDIDIAHAKYISADGEETSLVDESVRYLKDINKKLNEEKLALETTINNLDSYNKSLVQELREANEKAEEALTVQKEIEYVENPETLKKVASLEEKLSQAEAESRKIASDFANLAEEVKISLQEKEETLEDYKKRSNKDKIEVFKTLVDGLYDMYQKFHFIVADEPLFYNFIVNTPEYEDKLSAYEKWWEVMEKRTKERKNGGSPIECTWYEIDEQY